MAPTDYHFRLLTDNFAPILTGFSRSVVSDQCSTSFGKARVRFWLNADLPYLQNDVCFAPNSVAKLFSGCRIVIIESLYQMKRIILTEIGTATNQCYAKFPWTEFCNRIPQKADIALISNLCAFRQRQLHRARPRPAPRTP